MTIGFKQIPSNVRVPLFYAEVDNSQANTGSINQRTLLIGQITGSGTLTPNIPVISQGAIDARTVCGPGSMLARMVDAYRKNDAFGELWLLPLADDGSAVAATGTIVIAGPATGNGTIVLYIGGDRVLQGVTSGQTAAQIATALAATINAQTDLPVTAAASTATVTLTARNKGPLGNDIDVRANYLGAAGGESLPAGVTATITAMSGGTTAPTMTTAFNNLGDQPFDFICFPYNDTTSLDAVKGLLDDVTGRWSWARQVYGHAFSALKGNLSALTTAGVLRNDQHTSIIGVYDSPSQPVLWAAALTAAVATSVRADPALPLQTVVLKGVLAPPLTSRFQLTDRNTQLFDGISTFHVDDDGTVRIERCITTYQKNGFGVADNSYLSVETMFTLAAVLRALKTAVTSKFARVKLAADGTRFAPGSNIVTPSIIRAELVAQYRLLEQNGLVQQGDVFARNVIVQKNANDPNRVDVLYPAILVNQLNIFALLAQFRLQA